MYEETSVLCMYYMNNWKQAPACRRPASRTCRAGSASSAVLTSAPHPADCRRSAWRSPCPRSERATGPSWTDTGPVTPEEPHPAVGGTHIRAEHDGIELMMGWSTDLLFRFPLVFRIHAAVAHVRIIVVITPLKQATYFFSFLFTNIMIVLKSNVYLQIYDKHFSSAWKMLNKSDGFTLMNWTYQLLMLKNMCWALTQIRIMKLV